MVAVKKEVGISNSKITFTNTIPFKALYTIMETKVVNSDIIFTPDIFSPNTLPGAVVLLKLIPSETLANIYFSGGIKEITTSSGYDNTPGIENYLVFFYDGNKCFVNIYQEKDALPVEIPDEVAPILQSAVVDNNFKDRIILTYNELLNPLIIPTYSVVGKIVTGVIINNYTVTIIFNSNFASGNTILLNSDIGVQDNFNNVSSILSSLNVTNNIGGQIVTWANLTNASDSGGFLNYLNTTSGGRGTVSIDATQPFEVYAQLTSLSPATVLFLDTDSANAYVWGATQAFQAGVYQVGGTALYAAVNGTVPISLGAYSVPGYVKLRKSGNNIILSTCATENGVYSDVYTFTNALVSVNTLYIHVLFAANTVGDKIQVKYLV